MKTNKKNVTYSILEGKNNDTFFIINCEESMMNPGFKGLFVFLDNSDLEIELGEEVFIPTSEIKIARISVNSKMWIKKVRRTIEDNTMETRNYDRSGKVLTKMREIAKLIRKETGYEDPRKS